MYSNQIRELFDSVRVRLTFGLAAVFSICTVVAFLFLYYGLESALLRSVDVTLGEEVEECNALFAENGVEGVKEELRLEEESHGRKEIFFRIVNREGTVLAASSGARWEPALSGLEQRPVRVPDSINHPVFETLRNDNPEQNVRMVHALLGRDIVVQVFHGLHDSEHLLAEVFYVFLGVLVLLLVMAVAGTWYAVGRTMAGVRAVTHAALDIEAGDLRRRVSIGRGGREIRELADAFNKMLDKVAALVGALKQVSDDIAHELRSPIARIRGSAEMAVIASSHGENWQETAGGIVEDCDDLLALVNGMLDLAEMQAGLAGPVRDVVDLPRIVRDTCELFTPAAEDAGIAIVAEELPEFRIVGDESKLQRAIANLLDNAIKYTPKGGTITVSGTKSNGKGSIVVRDTGVGIGPDDLSHVFERFYRADTSRTRGGKGLGLGIVQAIVALHAGQIHVSSVLNAGTTFELSFPAVHIDTPQELSTEPVRLN